MDGSTLGLESVGSFNFTSVIGDPNGGANSLGFAKLGGGVLTLSAANAYTGPTTIMAGTLALGGGDNRLPVGTTLWFPENATLDVGDTQQTLKAVGVSVNNRIGTIIGNGTLRINGGDFALGGSGNNTWRELEATGLALVVFDAPEHTFSGP